MEVVPDRAVGATSSAEGLASVGRNGRYEAVSGETLSYRVQVRALPMTLAAMKNECLSVLPSLRQAEQSTWSFRKVHTAKMTTRARALCLFRAKSKFSNILEEEWIWIEAEFVRNDLPVSNPPRHTSPVGYPLP